MSNGFLAELRRRGVAKVAVVYAVVAWAVIESSSVIFPALQLPEWTVTFVVLLALFGFPVTLIFAWVFDWTREGIVKTPSQADLAPGQAASMVRGRVVDFVVIAVLVGVIGWLGWDRVFDPDEDRARLDSIAVLPFVNMSGDPENEYFGDGLAEELLNALVGVTGLRVAARTSSFEYKGQNLDIRRIGQALNVSTVLEGSVRKAGDRVRVTAQLIRADDGFHLWSETYDRELRDIFAVQDEIALAIVTALKGRLNAGERAKVMARHTTDVEAFEAYLRGRFEMHKRTQSSLEKAVEEFREAIRRDPGYAAAYSGLSDSWILLSNYGGLSNEEATRMAEPMARRALELDPELAEAHASLGLVLRNKQEVAASVEPFLRAIELNPSYSPAYHWLALSYQALGRYREGVVHLRKAVEIDPNYVTGKRALLGSLRNIGEHDEAEAYALRIAREHPDDAMLFYGLGGDAWNQGRWAEALRHYARGLTIQPDNISIRSSVAYLLLNAGSIARADEQAAVIRDLRPTHPFHDFWPMNHAYAVGDLAVYRREFAARLERMPPSMNRDFMSCSTNLIIGDYANAAVICRQILERGGWKPGAAIPPELIDPAANLLVAADALRDKALADALLPEFRRLFDRHAEGGLDEAEVRWARAAIGAFAGESVEPLLDELPSRLRNGKMNFTNIRTQPFLKPVWGDPRFESIVAEFEVFFAEQRKQMDRIVVPGP